MEKKGLILLLIGFISISLLAFDHQKVEKSLVGLTGNAKLQALMELGKYYFRKDPVKSMNFEKQALVLCRDLNKKSEEVQLLGNLGVQSINFVNKPKEGLNYFFSALEMIESNKDKRNLAMAYTNIGIAYESLSDNTNAIKYYKKAVSASTDVNDKSSQAISQNNLGNIYSKIGKYDEALKNYFGSLQLKEDIGEKKGIAVTYNNIGIIYEELGNLDKALEFHKQSLEYKRKANDTGGIAISLNNIANLYLKKGNYQDALSYYKEALKLKEKLGKLREISTTLRNIGLVYSQLNDFDNGVEYFSRAITIDQKYGNKEGLSTSYLNLAQCYEKRNNEREVSKYLKLAEKFALEINSLPLLEWIYRDYYEFYTKIDDSQQALAFYKKHSEVKEQLMKKKTSKDVLDITTKYETKQKEKKIKKLEKTKEKLKKETSKKEILLKKAKKETIEKEKQIQILEKQKKIDQLELKNRQLELQKRQFELNRARNQRLFFIVVLSLSFLLAIVIYRQFVNEKKNVKRLAEANNKINLQNEQLQELNKKQQQTVEELRQANATKNKFFSIIAHDLKNGFSSILSGTKLLTVHIDKLNRESIIDIASDLRNSTENLFNLLQNLLQWSRIQTNRIKNEPEKLPIYMLISHNVRLLRGVAEQKKIKLITDVTEYLYAYADKNMINSVIQNVIYNAIKFTKENGTITLRAHSENEFIRIEIQDEGVGMSETAKEKLFRLDKHYTTHGTANEQGTGLGLLLCKEFVEKNGGSIFLESEENVGTTVSFTLPEVGK